jgi:hypothetical protein
VLHTGNEKASPNCFATWTGSRLARLSTDSVNTGSLELLNFSTDQPVAVACRSLTCIYGWRTDMEWVCKYMTANRYQQRRVTQGVCHVFTTSPRQPVADRSMLHLRVLIKSTRIDARSPFSVFQTPYKAAHRLTRYRERSVDGTVLSTKLVPLPRESRVGRLGLKLDDPLP